MLGIIVAVAIIALLAVVQKRWIRTAALPPGFDVTGTKIRIDTTYQGLKDSINGLITRPQFLDDFTVRVTSGGEPGTSPVGRSGRFPGDPIDCATLFDFRTYFDEELGVLRQDYTVTTTGKCETTVNRDDSLTLVSPPLGQIFEFESVYLRNRPVEGLRADSDWVCYKPGVWGSEPIRGWGYLLPLPWSRIQSIFDWACEVHVRPIAYMDTW